MSEAASPRFTRGFCELTLETYDISPLDRFYVELLGWRCSAAPRRPACSSPGRRGGGGGLGARGEEDRGARGAPLPFWVRAGGWRAGSWRRGAAARGPLEHRGGDRSLYCEDPAGNVVELWDFFERGEGQRDGSPRWRSEVAARGRAVARRRRRADPPRPQPPPSTIALLTVPEVVGVDRDADRHRPGARGGDEERHRQVRRDAVGQRGTSISPPASGGRQRSRTARSAAPASARVSPITALSIVTPAGSVARTRGCRSAPPIAGPSSQTPKALACSAPASPTRCRSAGRSARGASVGANSSAPPALSRGDAVGASSSPPARGRRRRSWNGTVQASVEASCRRRSAPGRRSRSRRR